MFFNKLFDTRRAATLLIAAVIGVHVIHPVAADYLMPSYQHFAQPALQSLAGCATVFWLPPTALRSKLTARQLTKRNQYNADTHTGLAET